MDELLLKKCKEIFALCDREGKGYLHQIDLENVGRELQLSSEQLKGVFESLDEDGDGRLTFEEFVAGFAEHFMCAKNEEVVEDRVEERRIEIKHEDNFDTFLDHLNARNLFKDEEMVRALWEHLQSEEETEILAQFEAFLAKITSEMKKNQHETNTLQSLLQTKMNAYEEHMRHIYEEVESQIGAEKDKAKLIARETEKRIGADLRSKLEEKEVLVNEMEKKQSELEKQLQLFTSAALHSKQDRSCLVKEKEQLEKQLVSSQLTISELQKNLDIIQARNRDERRRRAKAALQVSEGIALEREELVKQLDLLKMINQQLRDEHDERTSPLPMMTEIPDHDSSVEKPIAQYAKKEKRGSVMSDYIQTKDQAHQWSQVELGYVEPPSEFQINGVSNSLPYNTTVPVLTMTPPIPLEKASSQNNQVFLQSINSETESDVTEQSLEEQELWNLPANASPPNPQSKRVTSSPKIKSPTIKNPMEPQRLFKVVFIGDSGVGKSSFIHRICQKGFRATFSATIGVDFHTHRVECNGQTVVLQLWDTAGQERFRSITNQYMRKADGVVIMYDVASETSFKNVRGWLGCVRDFTGVHTQILLIGNKMDLCSSSSIRAVQTSDGKRVAEENAGIFFETSVKTNTGVNESIHALACNLQATEDLEIEMALQLHMQSKNKKRCCL